MQLLSPHVPSDNNWKWSFFDATLLFNSHLEWILILQTYLTYNDQQLGSQLLLETTVTAKMKKMLLLF